MAQTRQPPSPCAASLQTEPDKNWFDKGCVRTHIGTVGYMVGLCTYNGKENRN